MLKVIAEDFIREEALEIVAPLYRELVRETQKEPGCIDYQLYVNESDPTHLVFIEQWVDSAALDRHCASEHFTRLVPQINQHAYQPCRVLRMGAF